MIIGHHEVTQILERELPAVTLLHGPPSIGKWTLTHHLATYHQVPMADHAIYPDGLHIDAVRAIKSFVATAPFGPYKLIQARLDGSTEPALNALLKTLEEPPPTVRFLLTSSSPTLDTVTSRCTVFRLGLLDEDELRQILIQQGLSPAGATAAAALGRGQVKPALAARNSEPARQVVLELVRSLALHDRALFARATKNFDDDARDMLNLWLVEAITGRWRVFNAEQTYGLTKNPLALRRMLLSLSALTGARARLGVRVALEPFLAAL